MTNNPLKNKIEKILNDSLPRLVLLGPPESGKTLFLSYFKEYFSQKRNSVLLEVNLRDVSLGSLNEMFLSLNRMIVNLASQNNISLNNFFNPTAINQNLVFKELIRHCLESSSTPIILIFDNLDSVPRYFAKDLIYSIRHFIELGAMEKSFRELGIILTGAVSLLELKNTNNSPIAMLDRLVFPLYEKEIQKQLVETEITKKGVKFSTPEIPDWLVENTKGEAVFLNPLLEICNSLQAIPEINREIYKQIPSLRFFAHRLWINEESRNIVQKLAKGELAKRQYLSGDVDKHHLYGSLIIERGKLRDNVPSQYKFRNNIVKSYLSELLLLIDNLPDKDLIEKNKDFPNLIELNDLEELHRNILNSEGIWECAKYIKSSWQKLTDHSQPDIHFYLKTNKNEAGWWLDTVNKSIISSSPLDIDRICSATKAAAYEAELNIRMIPRVSTLSERIFINCKDSYISVAYPLPVRDNRVILCATLSRTAVETETEFSEFVLSNWIEFINKQAKQIANLALSAFAEHSLKNHETELKTEDSENQEAIVKEISRTIEPRLFLVPEKGFLLTEHIGGRFIKGEIDLNEMEKRIKGWDKGLNDVNDNIEEFDEKIEEISEFLKTHIKSQDLFPNLDNFPAGNQIRIVSDIKSLMIPFELLRHGHDKDYLSLELAISRGVLGYKLAEDAYSSFNEKLSTLRNEGKTLRCLIVSADLDGELSFIKSEINEVAKYIREGGEKDGYAVDITIFDGNVSSLEELGGLMKEAFHIIHFSGHIRPSPNSENGEFVLSKNVSLNSRTLQNWLKISKPWLVYLGSCYSSAVQPKSFIQACLKAGVPYLIGFRWRVSDDSAAIISPIFYKNLFIEEEIKNVSSALSSARREIQSRMDAFDAWASIMLIDQTW
jgi:hypothetical protein